MDTPSGSRLRRLRSESLINPVASYAMYHDISAQKRAEEDLKALLLVDELTGLPNRRAFITLSEQAR